jgi:hypothetical protein
LEKENAELKNRDKKNDAKISELMPEVRIKVLIFSMKT